MPLSWDEARDIIISKLDIKGFYESSGVTIKSTNGDNVSCLCVFHEDTKPSLSINLKTGDYKCFSASCIAGAGGSIFDFYSERTGCSFQQSFKHFADQTGVELNNSEPEIDIKIVNSHHANLLRSETLMSFLLMKRGLTLESIKKFKLGFVSDRYTIPVLDEHGKVKRRSLNMIEISPEAGKEKPELGR